MNFDLEISNKLSEVNTHMKGIEDIQSKIYFYENKLNEKSFGKKDYSALTQLKRRKRVLEAEIKQLNVYIAELKVMRKNEIKKLNIAATNNIDRLFRNKAREILSEEDFQKIYDAIEPEAHAIRMGAIN